MPTCHQSKLTISHPPYSLIPFLLASIRMGWIVGWITVYFSLIFSIDVKLLNLWTTDKGFRMIWWTKILYKGMGPSPFRSYNPPQCHWLVWPEVSPTMRYSCVPWRRGAQIHLLEFSSIKHFSCLKFPTHEIFVRCMFVCIQHVRI